MEMPADVLSGIALGGAVIGGAFMKAVDKLFPRAPNDQPLAERLLAELLAATRANGETLRHLRDITADMQGDHRVLETKLDQLTQKGD